MLKSNDARLEVMNRFDRGGLCTWWEAEKRLPGGPICEIVDRLFLWGKYHPDNQHPNGLTLDEMDQIFQRKNWWADKIDRLFLWGKYNPANTQNVLENCFLKARKR
jgi:hypothetical protein